MSKELETYMQVQGFTEQEKTEARKKLEEDGEYTHCSSQFLGTPKAKVVKAIKEPK